MALDERDISSQETLLSVSVGEILRRNWWWEPEPVRLEHTPSRPVTPTRFDVISGSFQFPCALVDARAQALVEAAVRDGERHSLAVWRSALREALEQVSREAAHAPLVATCAALIWDRIGEEYQVAVMFEVRALPTARHTHQ